MGIRQGNLVDGGESRLWIIRKSKDGFKLAPDEISRRYLGLAVLSLPLGDFAEKYIDPGYRAAFSAGVAEIFGGKKNRSVQLKFKLVNAAETSYSAVLELVDAVIAVCVSHDGSVSDDDANLLIDASPLCCNIWDEGLRNIIRCNQEAVSFFGLGSKRDYIERFFELSPALQPNGRKSTELCHEYVSEAFRVGRLVFEWTHCKLDGEPIPCEITLVRCRRGSGNVVAGYTRDLREQKVMIDGMQAVERDLRRARDVAEKSALAKSEFLANMSHEIRTPMNAVLGMLHLTLNTELTSRQADYLGKAEYSAKALLRIINDILDFSKIEAGKLQMESFEFSLKNILNEVEGIFSVKMAEKGLSFAVDMDESLPEWYKGDPLRLNQILINLLGNATKFTSDGMVTLRIFPETQSGKMIILHFVVKDTGIGMTEQQISGLFTPFSQADNSTTRHFGGTGLGLAICRNLVNLMRGDIWCVSKEGEGTEFHFTAQLETDCNPVIARRYVKPQTIISKDFFAGKRVLLAEDNEINQIIADELLSAAGLTVDVANNGQEALDMLANNYYNAVFMDIQMPVMDGFAATQKIRKNPRFDKLPIIAMTAHAMSGDREKSIEAGMNDHITKPIDPDELNAALVKYLGD
ncbi:MAG: response regulator [Clostridiales bacterium]|jgi:signal transduction histidine kinase/CheY-like chemotaxis protein|nr:response regulator [Clostridiales bacterium]